MKKFIVLLLVALMIVGLFVSCKEEPKKEEPDGRTVEYVAETLNDCFWIFHTYVDEYLQMEKTAENFELLEEKIEEEFTETGANADASVTDSGISVYVSDDDNINTINASFTKLSIAEYVAKGDFSIKTSERIAGASIKMDATGSFEVDKTTGDRTIECTAVIVNGIDYKVEKINEALNKEIN